MTSTPFHRTLPGSLGTLSAQGPYPLDPFSGERLKGLHEVYSGSPREGVAAEGFALGLAMKNAGTLVWLHHDRGHHEIGSPSGGGLHEWGLNVEDLILVRVPDASALLSGGEDALRSGMAGAVLMSGWGEARVFTLTASRRLALAAAQGSTAAIVVRADADPRPSAAHTRWLVRTAPSRPLEAQAPGPPAFRVRLLRSRTGSTGEWIMEWDREKRSFVEQKASGSLVSVPAGRATGVRAA